MDFLLFSWGFWVVILASALAGVRTTTNLNLYGHVVMNLKSYSCAAGRIVG